MTDYLDVNRASWDDRAAAHAASPDYAVEQFAADPEFLSEVVRFDLPLLGDVRGARGVHLQCHIGTDTISLARLGADMTGLDFSGSVDRPGPTHLRAGADAGRVRRVQRVRRLSPCCRPNRYDLVFTGIGALCWLPDIDRWAGVVAALLRPGGRLFIREGHPMLWAIDESHTDALVVGYPYFEGPEPLIDDDAGTYVATDVEFTQNLTHSWNHGLGEIITALMDAGMQLTMLVEHDSVPWEALPGQMERTRGASGTSSIDRGASASVHAAGDEERVIHRRRGLPAGWEGIAAAHLGAWNGYDSSEQEQLGELGDWLLRHKNWEAANVRSRRRHPDDDRDRSGDARLGPRHGVLPRGQRGRRVPDDDPHPRRARGTRPRNHGRRSGRGAR